MSDERKYQVPLDMVDEIEAIQKDKEKLILEVEEKMAELKLLQSKLKKNHSELWEKVYEQFPDLRKKQCNLNTEKMMITVKDESESDGIHGLLQHLTEMLGGGDFKISEISQEELRRKFEDL